MIANTSDLANATALIAHERANDRAFVSSLIRAAGIGRVQHGVNGGEALWMIGREAYSVILIDWELGGMHALNFVHAVRRLRDPLKRATPIVMLSGRARREDIDQARSAGVDAYIAMPVSSALLAKRLRSVIAARQAFIVSDSYVGPCRRRKIDPDYAGPWRRTEDRKVVEPMDDSRPDDGARLREAARAQVNSLLVWLAAIEERQPDALRRFLAEVQSLRRLAMQVGDPDLEKGAAALVSYVNGALPAFTAARTHLDALRHLTGAAAIDPAMRRAVAAELERMSAKAAARLKA